MKITGISRNVLKLEYNIYTYHGGVDVYTHTQARAQTNTVFHPFIHFSLSILFPPPPPPSSSILFRFLLLIPTTLRRAERQPYLHNERFLGVFFCLLQREHAIGLLSLFLSSVDCWVLFTPKITIIPIYILLFPSQKDKEL